MSNTLPKSLNQLITMNESPVLVDFWSESCGACRMLDPVLRQVARIFKNNILITKVNVRTSGDLAMQYRISAVPTLILFYRGKVIRRWTGAMPLMQIQSELNRAMEELKPEGFEMRPV